MLHVLDDPWSALEALGAQIPPDGSLFASMLVSDRGVSRAYQSALRRQGEFGPPRSEREMRSASREIFGGSAEVTRTGAMGWLRVRTRSVSFD